MSDDEETDDLPGLVAACVGFAFMIHVGFSVVRMMPSEEHDPQPFMETFMEVAPLVWGIFLTLVGSLVVAIVTYHVVWYLSHDFGDDLRRWTGR